MKPLDPNTYIALLLTAAAGGTLLGVGLTWLAAWWWQW